MEPAQVLALVSGRLGRHRTTDRRRGSVAQAVRHDLQPTPQLHALLIAEPVAGEGGGEQHVDVVLAARPARGRGRREVVVAPLDGRKHATGAHVARLVTQEAGDEAGQLRDGLGAVAVLVVRVEVGVLRVEEQTSLLLQFLARLSQLSLQALVLCLGRVQLALHPSQLQFQARHTQRQL